MLEKIHGRISVLKAVYNEGKHVFDDIRRIREALAPLAPDYEIVVVDDGSRDATRAEIKRAAEEIGNVTFFSYPEHRGKGWALKRAFKLSCGEEIFLLDPDLEIDSSQFELFFRTGAERGADVVIGSKRHPRSLLHYPPPRRVLSGAYFFLVRLLFGLPLHDTQTGIKLFRREVLDAILPRIVVKEHAFYLELLVNAHHRGYRIAEAPVVVPCRGRLGRIGPGAVWRILTDTLAVFYRLRILGYYDRPVEYWPEKPLVSIVIIFREPTPHLEECLSKIGEMEYEHYEVILLPDGPMETSCEKVRVVPCGPMSPPRKRNLGAEEARGEIIAFIDDDAYPQEDWLGNAVRRFHDEEIAAVGGPASTPPSDGFREQASGRVLASWMVCGGEVYRYIPKMLKETDDCPTCNLLVRKSAFEAVGGFQIPYWPGDDTLLCLKIVKRLKKRILYDPDVQVWHHRRPLFKTHWAQISRYAAQRGRFVRLFPETSRRPGYFIPSLWTLFLFLGWLPLLLVPWGIRLYAALVAVYLLAALLTGLRSLRIKMALAVAAGIVSTHIVYGLCFMKGLLMGRRAAD